MARTNTTIVRLDEKLAHRLDDAAAKLRLSKIDIIELAIEEYVDRQSDSLLREEARRQSLLASRNDLADEVEAWENTGST